MANKKHKRLSAGAAAAATSTATAASSKSTASELPYTTQMLELVERTPENDYGVLSDPDELTENMIDVHLEKQEESHLCETPQKTEPHSPPRSPPRSPPQSSMSEQEKQLSLLPSSLELSPLEPLCQTSPTVICQEQETTYLENLKLKISSDKKYKEKMTLQTFFSFIIMILDTVLKSGEKSTSETEKNAEYLVEYLIKHHTVNENTEKYLQQLCDSNVVHCMIQSILHYSNDDPCEFEKLVLNEHEENGINTNMPVSPQTPQESRIRSWFKRFFCCCCGGC
jgi:hypothetical protein